MLISSRVSFVVAFIILKRSVFRSGRIACVSGSPNLALYSITLGPSFVIINPKYKHPLKGQPSFSRALTVGINISFSHMLDISFV